MRKFTCLTLLLLGLPIQPAVARDQHTHHTHSGHHQNAAAHQHGIGQLDLALEGNQLLLVLEMPAEDLLGFEHAPRDQAQRARLDEVRATLAQADQLFQLSGSAHCKLSSVELHSSLFARSANPGEPAPAGGHADIRAQYQYHCTRPEQLRHLDAVLFRHFPGSERLRVQAVTPRGQASGELTAEQPRLRL